MLHLFEKPQNKENWHIELYNYEIWALTQGFIPVSRSHWLQKNDYWISSDYMMKGCRLSSIFLQEERPNNEYTVYIVPWKNLPLHRGITFSSSKSILVWYFSCGVREVWYFSESRPHYQIKNTTNLYPEWLQNYLCIVDMNNLQRKLYFC